MSEIDTIRRLRAIEKTLDRLKTGETSGVFLPFSQRVLNPFPLASSGGQWGDMTQPAAAIVLGLYLSVFVVTTNNGTNFWTLDLTSDDGSTVLATLNTSAVAANGWRRLSTTTITTPGSTNAVLSVRPTATLSPGSIYITAALAIAFTG